MEPFFEKFEKRNGGVDEIPREEKEQRHMERINHPVPERGDIPKIVVGQHHQQNADAPGDVYIFDPFGHPILSSTEFYPLNSNKVEAMSPCLTLLEPIAFVENECGNGG